MTELKRKILAAVKSDLADIEQALADNLNPHFDLVRQVAGHILFSGGKRLRPLLMVLSARLCAYEGRDAGQFAAIFEYLHAATLLHDDVVDGGILRRGRTVAHQVWDQPTAVLTGDFLLARSLSLAARTGLPEVIETIAAITENMSQGEIHQLHHKGDLALTEADYLDVIRAKTAVLFQGACRVGALIARAARDQVRALADYGYHLGMAFQMADDLLDYIQDAQVLGKNPGADLREGKLTLPVIYALERGSGDDRRWMTTLIQGGDFKVSEFEQLVGVLNKLGGITYTRQCARKHIDEAKNALAAFSTSSKSEILKDLADYALLRTA